MAVIKKKSWPEIFSKVLSGEKKFEFRLNDFAVAPGDTIVLQEWDPKNKQYTGREITKKVGYVMPAKESELAAMWPVEEIRSKGLIIFGLED